MGMALDGDRLAVGTAVQVSAFINVPALAARLEPPGRHDACYLPRSSHFTGNIDLMTGQVVGLLRFDTAVQEVFAVAVLPGRRYPDLINDDQSLLENSFVVPTEYLGEVAATVRASEPA